MPWGVVASAAISAYSSNKASDKQADAAKKGIASTERLAEQARTDAVNLFNQGKQSRLLGRNAAFSLMQNNMQRTNQPMIQGNMMAQQAIGQGGIQANNAILGLPVDMSFANNPQQIQADYSQLENAQLPNTGGNYNVLGVSSAQPSTQPVSQAATQPTQTLTNKLGGRQVLFGAR